MSDISGCNFLNRRCCYNAIIYAISFTSSSFSYGSGPVTLLDKDEDDDDEDYIDVDAAVADYEDAKDVLRLFCIAP